ncbi:hypothetical protein ACIQXV_21540 [Neobacillus sp. NPDC097160]|uniref:hypothetical protein n=1 Tax=Neobacillus sp. NPDC097160 TaxID=3364298 RepID=UPI003829FF65
MDALIGLLKKDLTLMRFWYIVWLVFTALSMGGGYILSNWIAEPSVIVPIFVMLAGIHIFLMPIIILQTLRIEGKTQIWLYNPQSSQKLLFSKISAAFLLQIISQCLLSLYGVFVTSILVKHGLIGSFREFLPIKQGLFFHGGMLSISIYISLWVIFLWTVYHSLGKYPKVKNFRWLVVLLVWGSYNVFEALLVKLQVLPQELFTFGINLQVAPSMNYDLQNGWEIKYMSASLPIIPIILYTILTIILFFIASRLLDKKVEV